MNPDPARLRDLAISDSGFVFDPFTGYTFTVNATGLAILQALKEGQSLDQIVRRLQHAFELEGDEDLARDIDEFCVRLRDQKVAR